VLNNNFENTLEESEPEVDSSPEEPDFASNEEILKSQQFKREQTNCLID
jgi:hypothetical protein